MENPHHEDSSDMVLDLSHASTISRNRGAADLTMDANKLIRDSYRSVSNMDTPQWNTIPRSSNTMSLPGMICNLE